MFKILQAVYDRVLALKNGLTTNLTRWTGQPDTVASLDALLQQLQAQDADIKALEVQLHDKREQARQLAATISDAADQTERRASGIHATDTERLADYGLPVPGRTTAARGSQVPAKAVIRYIRTDDDGQGFITQCDRLPEADHYEVERGDSLNTLRFLRTTTKTRFVDDDVLTNVRYHYRVRGVNARGPGAWSEPVSAIQ